MDDIVKRLRRQAGVHAMDMGRNAFLDAAADEIERLRKIQTRLDGLARSAAGHIPNQGIADDFLKNITLCQSVDL